MTTPRTVADLAVRYAIEHPGLRERTLRTDEVHLRCTVLPNIGSMPIGEVTAKHIQMVLATRPDLAPKTRLRALGVLRRMFNFAVTERWVDVDPTKGIKVKGARKRTTRYLPTVDQVEQLRDEIDYRFSPIIDVMAYGGCSISEAAALRARDLDFDRRLLIVDRSIALRADGRREPSHEMKTDARDRRVPVIPEVVWQRLRPCAVDLDPDDLLVPAPGGGVLHDGNFRNRYFRRATARVFDGPTYPTPHDLRHFACSFWLAASCSEYEVADWAGHSDIGMLREVYGHALPRTGSPLEQAMLDAVLDARSRPRL